MFFWQKKEVLVTFSLNDFNRVKDILAENQIPYDWKTVPDCGRREDRIDRWETVNEVGIFSKISFKP